MGFAWAIRNLFVEWAGWAGKSSVVFPFKRHFEARKRSNQSARVGFYGGLRLICRKDYSYLNATMGSTRIARRAGMYEAARATCDKQNGDVDKCERVGPAHVKKQR
jgi:hypothetical protein